MTIVIGLGGAATLAADNEALVKDRQAAMRQRGTDLKTISQYVDDKGGDQASAVAAAKDMMIVEKKLDSVWLPGTSSKDMPGKSNAKPEIWTEMDKFKGFVTILKNGEEKMLPAIEKGDKAGAKAIIGDIGKNACVACHTVYREKAG
ncbi:MAG: c-type cytochrome [Acidobacteriota bacterium]